MDDQTLHTNQQERYLLSHIGTNSQTLLSTHQKLQILSPLKNEIWYDLIGYCNAKLCTGPRVPGTRNFEK